MSMSYRSPRRLDYPLYVVTAGVGDEVSGCLAGYNHAIEPQAGPFPRGVCLEGESHVLGR